MTPSSTGPLTSAADSAPYLTTIAAVVADTPGPKRARRWLKITVS